MVDGRFGVHRLVEGITVPVAVAKLEPCQRAGNVDVFVVGEPIELSSKRVLADLLQRRGGYVNQQLQRGQPLLAVDDAARLQVTEDRLLRLNHDRPEKVLGIGGRLPEPSSASRRTSCHSGAHCSSYSHTYGRWNGGTTRCCGCMKTSCGVRTCVSIR